MTDASRIEWSVVEVDRTFFVCASILDERTNELAVLEKVFRRIEVQLYPHLVRRGLENQQRDLLEFIA